MSHGTDGIQGDSPKLRIGVAPVATVEVTGSWLRRMWRRFAPKPLAEKIVVPCGRSHIYITEEDHGDLNVHLTVVNFSRRRIVIGDVQLKWLAFGNGGIDQRAAHLGPDRCTVPGRTAHEILVRIPLNQTDVRRIKQILGPPTATHGTPGSGPLAMRGVLVLERPAGSISFSVGKMTPYLAING